MLQAWSLMVWIYCLISGTCLLALQQFRHGKFSWIGLNSGLARIIGMLNPQCLYRCTTPFNLSIIVQTCLLGRASTVPKWRLCDVVMRNGTLFVNMTLIALVMDWCVLRMSGGMGSTPAITCGSGQDTILPISDPRLGL